MKLSYQLPLWWTGKTYTWLLDNGGRGREVPDQLPCLSPLDDLEVFKESLDEALSALAGWQGEHRLYSEVFSKLHDSGIPCLISWRFLRCGEWKSYYLAFEGMPQKCNCCLFQKQLLESSQLAKSRALIGNKNVSCRNCGCTKLV